MEFLVTLGLRKATSVCVSVCSCINLAIYPHSRLSFYCDYTCRLHIINKCFARPTVEEIIASLVRWLCKLVLADASCSRNCLRFYSLDHLFSRRERLLKRMTNGSLPQFSRWRKHPQRASKFLLDRYGSISFLSLYYFSAC